jgi:phage terminase small subunit
LTVLKNSRHEKFAQAAASGKAHRLAYQETYGTGGASADAAASKLLRIDKVSGRISELKAEAATAAGLEGARVLAELARVGFGNVLDFAVVGDDGLPHIDLSIATYEKCGALASIEVEEHTEGTGDDARQVRKVRLKLADKVGALNSLGKHFDIFRPTRVEVSGPGGGPIEVLTDLEAARRIAWLLNSAATKAEPAEVPAPATTHSPAPPEPSEPEPAVDAEAHLAALLSGDTKIGDNFVRDRSALALLDEVDSRDTRGRYWNGGTVAGEPVTATELQKIHEELDEARREAARDPGTA